MNVNALHSWTQPHATHVDMATGAATIMFSSSSKMATETTIGDR